MSLEQTHEEEDIEAADEDGDASPPTPHAPRRDPVGRLSGDLKEHQLQAIVGGGKKKCPQKLCRVCDAHKESRRQIYLQNMHKGECFTSYHSRMKY
jgi:hypothetical protein